MTVGWNSGVGWFGESVIGSVCDPLVLRDPGDELAFGLTNTSSITATTLV